MSEIPKPTAGATRLQLSADGLEGLPAEAERPFSVKWHEPKNLEQPPSPPDPDIDESHSEIEQCRLNIKKLEIKCSKLAFQNERMAGIITRGLKATVDHSDNTENLKRITVLKAMFRVLLASFVFKFGKYRIFSLEKFEIALKNKKIFDSDAYLARYPDVASAGIDPILHFAAHGISEGRDRGF